MFSILHYISYSSYVQLFSSNMPLYNIQFPQLMKMLIDPSGDISYSWFGFFIFEKVFLINSINNFRCAYENFTALTFLKDS